MKLVESKKEEITIDEVIDRFNELIVAAYDRKHNDLYLLIKDRFNDLEQFIWVDFVDSAFWDISLDLDDILSPIIELDFIDVQVFETYKEFIEWVGELPLDK